jgi:hypothetical protein
MTAFFSNVVYFSTSVVMFLFVHIYASILVSQFAYGLAWGVDIHNFLIFRDIFHAWRVCWLG